MSENMQPHYTTVRVPERPRRGGRLVPMVPALTWTSDPPTAPGFYWAKATRAHPPIVVEVVWAAWLDRVLVVQVTPDRYEDPSRYVAWAGPLVPPGGE